MDVTKHKKSGRTNLAFDMALGLSLGTFIMKVPSARARVIDSFLKIFDRIFAYFCKQIYFRQRPGEEINKSQLIQFLATISRNFSPFPEN